MSGVSSDARAMADQVGDKLGAVPDQAAATGRSWMDKLTNNPLVANTAANVRQRAGAAQDQVQPLLDNDYVQRGANTVRAGGERAVETGKKVYRNEPGYEKSKFLPLLALTVGLLVVGYLLRGMKHVLLSNISY